MGKSFWPFLVRSQEDIDKVKKLRDAHNMRQDVGEALESGYVVRYRGHYFWLLKVRLVAASAGHAAAVGLIALDTL
jgi:hypothetical protein